MRRRETDVCGENTDVRLVGFHPLLILQILFFYQVNDSSVSVVVRVNRLSLTSVSTIGLFCGIVRGGVAAIWRNGAAVNVIFGAVTVVGDGVRVFGVVTLKRIEV